MFFAVDVMVSNFANPIASRHPISAYRRCKPTGRRKAPPDDRLREAIHAATVKKLDCFVALLLAMTKV
jgi:hypothetical protein